MLNVKLVIVILNEMNIIAFFFVFLVIVIINEMNAYVTFVELSYVATTYRDKEWNLFVIIFSVIVIDLMFLGGGFSV